MNTDELIDAISWIDQEVKAARVLQNYADLSARLQSTAAGSPLSFGDQREKLIEQLRGVDILGLTHEQRNFLFRLNLINHLGDQGVAELEEILYKNSLDPATAAAKVTRIVSDIQQAVDRSDQIKASISGLFETGEALSEEALVRVVFDRDASISDVVDFKKWAAEWFDIGRGIAMAVGAAPEEIKVVGAQKGSIIIELATTYGIAQVIATVLLKSLEVAEKVLSVRKMALEVENLKLNNQVLSKQILEEAAKNEKESGLVRIAEEIKETISRQLNGEEQKALESSTKKLLSFVEKGGEVDVIMPPENEDANDEEDVSTSNTAKRLREDIHRIRSLEAQIKAIEHHPKQ